MKIIKKTEVENLIRAGYLQQAQHEVLRLALHKNSRADRLQIAHWARRTGLEQITLRLLHHHVRALENPTTTELTEYAMALIRQGFFMEAHEILSRPIVAKSETFNLFRGFAYIYQWDYESARPFIAKYLEQSLNEYDRKIGEINLAACDTLLKPAANEHLGRLEKLEIDCGKIGAKRIQANALELMAQTYVYLKDFKNALKILTRAETMVNLDATFEGSFIKKWRAFAELGQNPESNSAIQKVIHVRESARQAGFFEVVRDCDFHLGIWNRNRTVLQRVYYGSPFPAYRQRVLAEAKEKLKIESSYIWRLNNIKRPEKWIDLKTGQNEKKNLIFSPQKQTLHLLAAMASDFYRPIQVSNIFQTLFSDQFFDPFSSSNRIDQAILRLRRHLKDHKIPLLITKQSGFKIMATADFGLIKYLDRFNHDLEFEKLESVFKNTEFKLLEALTIFKIPKRSLQALFKKWVDAGKLKVSGGGASTRYLIS